MLPDSSTPAPGGLAGLAAAFAIVAALIWVALRPAQAPLPAPEPASAPATAFAAGRALPHVEELARAPRPIGGSANRQARDYLLAQLRMLGLAPQVQRAVVRKNWVDYNANYEATMGVVHNVLVRLPGSAPDRLRRPALLLAAHLDSDAGSLAAARGATPMAALLETLRALRAGPPLENDVLVLFADGEHVGSLGMQAFAEQHPWAREVGLALRFDGLGSGGPLELVNTEGANSAAIDGWLHAAPDVPGSSLLHEVLRFAPGAPRIGALGKLGVPVLQFANRGRPFDRDGVLDTPRRLEHATLQHMGEAMLRLTRHFGRQRLHAQSDQEQVYFSLPFIGTVHYSGDLIWPLTRLTCLLLVGALCIAVQRSPLRYPALLGAVFVVPGIAVALGMLAWQLWMHVPTLHSAWNPAAPRHLDTALLYLCGVCALCGALFVVAQRQLVRLTGFAATVLAAMFSLLLVLLAASWLAPGASYLVAWPLLSALACFVALHSRRVASWPALARLAVLVAGVAPAALLVPPMLRDSYLALSPLRMNVPVAMLALLLGVSLPLLAHARRGLARVLLVSGLGTLALAGRADGYSEAAAPRPNALVYYKDMPTWDAYWLHPEGPLDPWTRDLFSNLREPHIFMEVFGWESPRQWYAWAPRDGLVFPFVRIHRNGKAPQRHADFTLVSANRAPEVRLRVIGARPTRVTVNGRVMLDKEAKTLTLVLYGMEDEPLHFRIDVGGDPLFAVRIEEVLPGLPAHLLPPRPAGAPALTPLSGKSIAADTLWFY